MTGTGAGTNARGLDGVILAAVHVQIVLVIVTSRRGTGTNKNGVKAVSGSSRKLSRRLSRKQPNQGKAGKVQEGAVASGHGLIVLARLSHRAEDISKKEAEQYLMMIGLMIMQRQAPIAQMPSEQRSELC